MKSNYSNNSKSFLTTTFDICVYHFWLNTQEFIFTWCMLPEKVHNAALLLKNVSNGHCINKLHKPCICNRKKTLKK